MIVTRSSGGIMNLEKKYSLSNALIAGILLIILGIAILVWKDQFYIPLVHLIVFCALLVGIYTFFKAVLSKEKKKDVIVQSLLNLIFAFVLSFFPKIPLSFVPLIFATYLIVNALIKIILYLVLRKNKGEGRFKELFLGLAYLAFGIPLLISPLRRMNNALVIIGGYFILLGTTNLLDVLFELVPVHYKNRMKRRVRVTMPVIFEALIPYGVLVEINHFLSNETSKDTWSFEKKKQDQVPDMEIFVHTSPNGFNRVGHVDLYFDGEIISYGNYDNASKKFFESVGDGVLFTTNKEAYIPFCIKEDHKTLFGFGLRLTEAQKKNVRKQIDEIKSLIVPWDSPLKEAQKNNRFVDEREYKDYASKLYFETGAKTYKFTKGRFKTFFVLGNNCCLLADRIIGKSGTDILKMNGIITPGTYFDYLSQEYAKKNSMVISRTIYNEISTKKKKGFKKMWQRLQKNKEE